MNANSYYSYNQLPNESDLTFRDQDGNTRTLHVQLVCVEHLNSETRYLNLSKNYCLFLEKIICFDKWKN